MEDIFSPDHLTEVLISGVAPEAQGPAAAVAAVARKGKLGAELLFIERSTKKDDPWSGQMAFPGGRASDNDQDSLATAVRETNEELGIDLVDSLLLGRLSDVEGGPRGTRQRLTVTCLLYTSPSPRDS